jgi:hypothetical protein
VKRTLLLRFLLRRSPPDSAFASSGGRAVSLPVARGNASVGIVLEFVVIPTNSVVVFLSVVVRCLPPAAAASGWVAMVVAAAFAVAAVGGPGPVSGGRGRGDGRRRGLPQVPDAVGGGCEGPSVGVVSGCQRLPDGLRHSEQKERVEQVCISGGICWHKADEFGHEL